MRLASLWQDPRTGVWTLRKRIPKRYREVADQRGETVKITTGTADRKLAESRLPDVLRRWAEKVAKWEERLNGGQESAVATLTDQQIYALAGAEYVAIEASYGGNSGDPGPWGETRSDLWDQVDRETPDGSVSISLTASDKRNATAVLALHGIAPDPVTVERLGRALFGVKMQIAELMERRGRGDWSPDTNAARFPPIQTIPQTTPISIATPLSGLFEKWKAVADVKPRSEQEAAYAVKGLVSFLGHDDATKIDREGLIRWRDSMIAAGRTNNTWNNRLSLLIPPDTSLDS